MNVVLVGDCGVDRYVSLGLDRPGGITLNVAAHARRLFPPGSRIRVVTALGTDPESEIVKRALRELGVESFVREIPGSTSLQIIDLEPSGEKIFVSYHQGVLGDYRVGGEERALIGDADLLVAPHYRQIDGFFSSVMDAPSRGLRAVDFADIAEEGATTNVERFLDRFDVGFFGLGPAHEALIGDLEVLAHRDGKLFIVTLGPEGSLALGAGGRFAWSAAPVEKVVDTTGAGDTFAAAFLSEYCKSRNVPRSLERGAEEAARTIARIGAF
ncbi:MAG: PfkB family carbohydrate kinase [Vicinamibacteria bacterium]